MPAGLGTNMKLTFLLGSGISLPAGLPSVAKLTEAMLSGDGMTERRSTRIQSGHYDPREAEESERDRRILIFLAWLKAQAACRYAEVPDRWINYEDLAYLGIGRPPEDSGIEIATWEDVKRRLEGDDIAFLSRLVPA